VVVGLLAVVADVVTMELLLHMMVDKDSLLVEQVVVVVDSETMVKD
jgi:hypothetical protein